MGGTGYARADALVMNSLRKIFHDGDTDGSGELDLEDRASHILWLRLRSEVCKPLLIWGSFPWQELHAMVRKHQAHARACLRMFCKLHV